ncbi:MAG TPA: hypothetical protein VJ799_09345 [Nitrososphaeraceae archaeon]|nr:hypothetical protein [Nitrososphaeraceae archaeon]
MKDSGFLKSIGDAQMMDELESKILEKLEKRVKKLEKLRHIRRKKR